MEQKKFRRECKRINRTRYPREFRNLELEGPASGCGGGAEKGMSNIETRDLGTFVSSFGQVSKATYSEMGGAMLHFLPIRQPSLQKNKQLSS